MIRGGVLQICDYPLDRQLKILTPGNFLVILLWLVPTISVKEEMNNECLGNNEVSEFMMVCLVNIHHPTPTSPAQPRTRPSMIVVKASLVPYCGHMVEVR